MTHVNPKTLKAQNRRPATQWISPEAAIQAANEAINKANDHAAKAAIWVENYERVAAEAVEDNQRLRAENEQLKQENTRLKKQLKPKAGKNRERDRLEEENYGSA